jgi:hypothetical protein
MEANGNRADSAPPPEQTSRQQLHKHESEHAARDPSWLSSPSPPPRHRATSLLARPLDAPPLVSPLAQVFQPFVIGIDNMIPEEHAAGPHSAIEPSFGPASRRRRLSSLHARTASISSALGNRKPSVQSGLNLSVTPPQLGIGAHSSIPETATQIEKDEENGIGPGTLMMTKRLDQMEQRQERIEQLLIDISRTLQLK